MLRKGKGSSDGSKIVEHEGLPATALTPDIILNKVLSPVDPAVDMLSPSRKRYLDPESTYWTELTSLLRESSIPKPPEGNKQLAHRIFEKSAFAPIDQSLVESFDRLIDRAADRSTDYPFLKTPDGRTRFQLPDADTDLLSDLTGRLAHSYAGRIDQKVYFKRLVDTISEAHTASDMVGLVDSYVFLRTHSRAYEGDDSVLTFASMLGAMFERAGELHQDPYDGTANPEAIADMLEDAVERLISYPDIEDLLGLKDAARGINTHISIGLLSYANKSTAEGVAALRVRERLAKKGYPNFERAESAKRHAHKIGDRYVTAGTVKRITENFYGEPRPLEQGEEAISASAKIITDTVDRLAATGSYPVASQIKSALDKLAVHGRAGRSALPYGQIIHLGNLLATQLNDMRKTTGEAVLSKLDTKSMLDLPAAFQRILTAIDPNLLEEALAPDQTVDEAVNLRLRMIYLEALSIQWQDSQRRYSMTVGDMAMRLSAYGMSNEETAEALQEMRADHEEIESAREQQTDGGIAVSSLREVVQHWRTDENVVRARAHRSGHGAIS